MFIHYILGFNTKFNYTMAEKKQIDNGNTCILEDDENNVGRRERSFRALEVSRHTTSGLVISLAAWNIRQPRTLDINKLKIIVFPL